MATTTVAALPATGIWRVDPSHSVATFGLIHHGVATFRASFPQVTGAFNAEARQLTGEVPAENLLIPPFEARRTAVLSTNYLNAEEFPVISFESTGIEQDGHDLTVTGRLTLRGVTKDVVASGSFRDPIAFEALRGGEAHRFGMDLSTTIDRRDHGVMGQRQLDKDRLSLGWDVKIEVTMDLVLVD